MARAWQRSDAMNAVCALISLVAVALALRRARLAEMALMASEETCSRLAAQDAGGRSADRIAHDFNNLLTTISGYADLLITNLPSTDPMVQDVYEIQRAASSATRLTNRLASCGGSSEPCRVEPSTTSCSPTS